MRVCAYVCVYVCMCAYVNMCARICAYVCVCVYVCTSVCEYFVCKLFMSLTSGWGRAGFIFQPYQLPARTGSQLVPAISWYQLPAGTGYQLVQAPYYV